MKKPLAILLTLGVALATPAWARHDKDEGGRPVNEHRPLKADARVYVSNVAGLIEVETWDKKELWLTGELGEDVEKLEITGSESSLKIEVKLPRDSHNVEGDTHLKLQLPPGVALEAEGVSADIRVRGLQGPLSAESVSGDVRLVVESAKVKASSVSGDVTLEAPASETRVSSVSGDVNVRGVKGELNAETVSGDVHLQARELRKLDVETVSGDLELDLDSARDADISVETLSGEVRLTLPSMPDGEIRLETFSGEITSPWWSAGDGDDEKEYRHDGNGKGRLRLHSFSGDIVLKKK